MEINERLYPNMNKVKCLHCDAKIRTYFSDNESKQVFCKKCGAFGKK